MPRISALTIDMCLLSTSLKLQTIMEENKELIRSTSGLSDAFHELLDSIDAVLEETKFDANLESSDKITRKVMAEKVMRRFVFTFKDDSCVKEAHELLAGYADTIEVRGRAVVAMSQLGDIAELVNELNDFDNRYTEDGDYGFLPQLVNIEISEVFVRKL